MQVRIKECMLPGAVERVGSLSWIRAARLHWFYATWMAIVSKSHLARSPTFHLDVGLSVSVVCCSNGAVLYLLLPSTAKR